MTIEEGARGKGDYNVVELAVISRNQRDRSYRQNIVGDGVGVPVEVLPRPRNAILVDTDVTSRRERERGCC